MGVHAKGINAGNAIDYPMADRGSDGSTNPGAFLVRVVADAEAEYGTPVPYERVVQIARRETDLNRGDVTHRVESLVEEGRLVKVGADRLLPVRS